MSFYPSNSPSSSLSKKAEVPLLLGSGSDRLMSWCPSLNIYRVNRFNILTNDQTRKQSSITLSSLEALRRFDFIEELLMHNLIHVAEEIFAYVGYPYTWSCLRVSRLWYEFLSNHLFPRWAEKMMCRDPSISDIYASDELTSMNPSKICWQVYQLKEVWQNQRPKIRRLSCDSFVLSLKVYQDRYLYCGLNNGSLQLWDLTYGTSGVSKIQEKEVHDKGVKSLDVGQEFIVTGSYDCTAKVWLREENWNLLHVINLHNDSVWDLRLNGSVLVTGGLDGVIGIFSIVNRTVLTRFLFKACEDLVAAVDFDDNLLIAGFEDSLIGIWTVNDANLLRKIGGHTGGITGIKLNGQLFATSSYDGSVRLWTVSGQNVAVFDEPAHLLRCIGFSGNTIVSGDFGGNLHLWEIEWKPSNGGVRIKRYHHTQIHKSHVVCLQVNVRRIVSGSRDKTVLVQDFWAAAANKKAGGPH